MDVHVVGSGDDAERPFEYFRGSFYRYPLAREVGQVGLRDVDGHVGIDCARAFERLVHQVGYLAPGAPEVVREVECLRHAVLRT